MLLCCCDAVLLCCFAWQEGWWKWLSGVIDNSLYPILFLDYLKRELPCFESGLPRATALILMTLVLYSVQRTQRWKEGEGEGEGQGGKEGSCRYDTMTWRMEGHASEHEVVDRKVNGLYSVNWMMPPPLHLTQSLYFTFLR